MNPHENLDSKQDSDSPPILKTWSRLYSLLLTELVLLIILFYLFMKIFS